MKPSVCTIVAICLLFTFASGQAPVKDNFEIRGLSIPAPSKAGLDSFVRFINTELATRNINTLVLHVNYSYQYKSHPELAGKNSLGFADMKKIADAAQKNNINIIPLINLLGHQSWASTTGKLLEVYPEFDETPWVKIPAKYEWPNADSLYCKSYCPLHPNVHKIVFDLVDEICDVFNATNFHAGMDEVFYIGTDKCPRCKGKNKAALFAGEVKIIRNHLARKGRKLWIWGDRLLDGYTTGLGMWEASYNNTHPAIDIIPKDVVICDWHYVRADKTAVYFASKGFNVITCPWNKPTVAVEQVADMKRFKTQSTPEMSNRFLGTMHTVWSDPARFLHEFYYSKTDTAQTSQAETFKRMFNN